MRSRPTVPPDSNERPAEAEELQSANKELQSINEELEATSEEVQSANEELRTLNEELHSVNDRLANVNDDLEHTRDFARTVVDTVREPLLVLGADLRVVSANLSYYRQFETIPEAVIGQAFFELDSGQWNIAELREAIEGALRGDHDFQELVIDRAFERIGTRIMVLSGRRVRTAEPGVEDLLLAIDDITERAMAERQRDRLDEERQRDWRLNNALARLATASAARLNEAVLPKVLDDAMEVLGADSARYLHVSDGNWETRYASGETTAQASKERPGLDPDRIASLERDRVPLIVTSEDSGSGSPGGLILLPLLVDAELAGALEFGYKHPEAFTDAHYEFARRLSFVVSLTLQNTRLYESQRDLAERMQDVLLEVPRETDRVEFAHLYRSATREASIGGDFYDVFEAQKKRVALLIGDVSGHGVGAARIARSTKDVIHAFAHRSRHPRLILRETNELLIEKRIPGFVTVFLGILNPDSGMLTYCSAGHPNAMLRTGSGEVRLLDAASAPLGVYPGYSWEEDHVQLGVTDLLLLYTDGLIEARDGKDFYGQERLMDALGRSSTQQLEDLPRVLLEEVLTFSSSRLADDIAILAATIGGGSASA